MHNLRPKFNLGCSPGMSLIEILISLVLAAMIIFAAGKMLNNSAKMAQNAEFKMTEENMILHNSHKLARELENAHVMQARMNYFYEDAGSYHNSTDGSLICGKGLQEMLTTRPANATTKEVRLLRGGDTFGFIYSAMAEISSFYQNPSTKEFVKDRLVVADPQKYKVGDLIMISTRNANYQTAFLARVSEVTPITSATRTITYSISNLGRNLLWQEGPCTYQSPEGLEDKFLKDYLHQEDVLRIDRIHQVKYYLQSNSRYENLGRPFFDLYRQEWKNEREEPTATLVAEKIIGLVENASQYTSEMGVTLLQTWTPTEESSLSMLQSAQENNASQSTGNTIEKENSYLGTTNNELRIVYAGALGDGEDRGQVIVSQSSYSFTSSGRANFDLVLEGEIYSATAPALSLDFREFLAGKDELSCGDGKDYFQLFKVTLYVEPATDGALSNLTNEISRLKFIGNENTQDIEVKCTNVDEKSEDAYYYKWSVFKDIKEDSAVFRAKDPTLVCCARFKSHSVKYCRTRRKHLPASAITKDTSPEEKDPDILPVRFRGTFAASVMGAGAAAQGTTKLDDGPNAKDKPKLRGLLWKTPIVTFYLTNPFLGEKFCDEVDPSYLQNQLLKDKEKLLTAFSRGCKKGSYTTTTIEPPQFMITDTIIGSRSRPVKTMVHTSKWKCEGKVDLPCDPLNPLCDYCDNYDPTSHIYSQCRGNNKTLDNFIAAKTYDSSYPGDESKAHINKCWLNDVHYYPEEIARTIIQSCFDGTTRMLIKGFLSLVGMNCDSTTPGMPGVDDCIAAKKTQCGSIATVDNTDYDSVKSTWWKPSGNGLLSNECKGP